MEAKKKNTPKPAPRPEEGLYDDVNISAKEDQTLRKMQAHLKQQFDSVSSYAYDDAEKSRATTAATGYAVICTELRERAMLRAHQKHFRKK